MTSPTHKYTDRDVRESPELVSFALEYLQLYEGDFQYLLDAQTAYREHNSLTVPIVRGVLNCILNDARYVHKLPAQPIPVPKVAKLKLVPPPYQRPWIIQTKVRVHKKYWFTLNPVAKYYHVIDNKESVGRYYTETDSFKFDIRAACGKILKETQDAEIADWHEVFQLEIATRTRDSDGQLQNGLTLCNTCWLNRGDLL